MRSLPVRVARAASPRWNLAKTAVQALAFWFLFLVAAPLAILLAVDAMGLPDARFVGLGGVIAGTVVIVAATVLSVASAITMARVGEGTPLPLDTARRLVTRGPYRLIRNPMAVAGIAQGIGVGLILGSPWVVAYALAGAVLWHVAIRPGEEADLVARFGEEYREYRARVPLWVPRPGRREPRAG
jgi:protein-S-isoprenylcysteine O-methyltransferase Ste14